MDLYSAKHNIYLKKNHKKTIYNTLYHKKGCPVETFKGNFWVLKFYFHPTINQVPNYCTN